MRVRHLALSLAVPALAASLPATAGAAGPALGKRCVSASAAGTGEVISLSTAGRYSASSSRRRAVSFRLQPTRLGAHMLLDGGGQLAGVRAGRLARIGGVQAAGPGAEWAIRRAGRRTVTLTHTADGRGLRLTRGGALIVRRGRGSRFILAPARGCIRFPEAEVGASGRSFSGTTRSGTVGGFIDTHLHITADMRAGGRVLHGKAFDRFGIAHALGGDALDHGADGSKDITGNLLRDGIPFGTHSVEGWPSFKGWPSFDTNTHQQTYWAWLARAWKAGLRLVVAQTVEDDQLCLVVPVRSHSCDETETIALEVRRLRALQNYVDAQSGGRGRGWFRLVYGPRQARRVIESGRLAVVIGVESSNLFGCGLTAGGSRCTRADVDRGIRRFRRLGVRSLFVAHWLNNAFAGAALEGGVKGVLINGLNALRTGSYFATAACPQAGQGEEVRAPSEIELTVLAPYYPAVRQLLGKPVPAYPSGRQCNERGLTPLGEYLIRRLMANHMLIEVDHMSERARERVLALAESRRYPLVSSHNGTGGAWTPAELRRLYALGGLASATSGDAPELIDKILGQRQFRSPRRYFGVGLGTDTGGFASLPGAPTGAAPLRYPFRSFRGNVSFRRQRTGTRTFDFNADGVAHYGLFADLLADVGRRPRGEQALSTLFRSAEAYLQMWRRSGER